MAKHRDIIAIEREAGQEVRFTIGQTTEGGGLIPGGFSQLFNRVISSLAYARLPEAAKLVYPALVWMADHRRQFVIENRGYSEIARYAGVSRSTAQKGLAKLIEAGLIRLARPARPDGRGGLTANIYQMLVPIDGLDPVPADELPRTVLRERGIPAHDTGVDRHAAHPSAAKRQGAVPRSGRFLKEEESDNSNSVADRSAARGHLSKAGVREPVLGNLLAANDEEELLLRLKDWEHRKAAGAKLGVAWLIASIQQKYELHETTRRDVDRSVKAKAATAHRQREQQREADEDRRQQEIERQVVELFDAMSDEELDHWKAVVVGEFPSIVRNADRADPRTHERLRRLILGKLATIVCPPEAEGRRTKR